LVCLSVRKVKQPTRKVGRYKYLITWNLLLNREDLEKISWRSEALQKGLNYLKNVAKGARLTVYRIVEMEEITRHTRLGTLPASANPSGVAIAEANSVEEARRMIDEWVEGLTYGGMPVGGRLEYEIKPLVELTGK
jgi:hypothetical protein